MKHSKGVLLAILLVSLLCLLQSCSDANAHMDEPLHVGIVYVSTPGSLGDASMHDEGRRALEHHFGDRIKVTRLMNIPENSQSSLAFNFLIDEGCKLIFGTSYNYQKFMQDVAKNHPDVLFEHCSGYLGNENMSSYFARMYQARYLTGIIAGSMTTTNKIGFVAPFSTPDIVRGINAFTLGVRSVNADAMVYVAWSETWFNPTTECQKAQDLLSQGCDVLAQHQDSSSVASTAITAGKYAIGYNADFGSILDDDNVLVSSLWCWENYMIPTVQAALDGTWEHQDYWGGFEDGMIKLSAISTLVPQNIVQLVQETENAMENQTFDVFWDELKDENGAIKQPAGGRMADITLRTMDWFVQGVIGNID